MTNEGCGLLALVSLTSDSVAGHIDAVRSNEGCDDDRDDHSDNDCAPNKPVISSLQPASGMAGSTLTLNIAGTNLNGVMAILFIGPNAVPDSEDFHGHASTGITDSGITVSGITSTATSVTAQVKIADGHAASQRLVLVVTPNGVSSSKLTAADTFTTQ